MSATKTQAFVLKTQDYRDTSLLGYFYTRDFGKIHGIIKGIRDTRARFGGTLEPFSLNEILFYRRRRGGDLHQVTQVDLLDAFTPVREDLERLAYASYFVDLLNEWVEIEEPNPAIFDLMREVLRFLGSGVSPKRAARIFEIKLCEQLGLTPQIGECAVCGAKAPEPAYFNASIGGIHCRDCQPGGRISSLPVSKGTLNFLEHVRRSGIAELQNVKVSQEVGEGLEKVLRRFVDFHLTQPLKTVAFLQQMGM